ncbi:FAD-binding oxidoreductase [Halodurantibacterium flavum]|uniref:FAD-binding oxidoreductase n=1 Tax=Halodurantibacterium flavum TaxID=1382802 RepID=A0ABW4S0T4_9RHOB
MTDAAATALLQELTRIVGAAHIRSGADFPARHLQDAAQLPPETPLALVRPGTTAEVAAVMALCHDRAVHVVVQGGLTGLAGGAHPLDGEVALSLERMNAVEDVDVIGRSMTVQAGATLQSVQEAAAAAGLHYPVDLGSRGSCTIGGTVATNAGGVQVLRYGMTRRQVLGMEAVLPDGRVLSGLNRLTKNNTGYDWKEILIGSEGTLAAITRVVLALQPRPSAVQTVLCACGSTDAAFTLQRRLEQGFPGGLLTFEGMWRDYLDITRPALSGPPPFTDLPPLALLIEIGEAGNERPGDALLELLAQAMEDGLLSDAVVAQSLSDRGRLWEWREANAEFGRLQPKGLHYDVSVPRPAMDEAIRRWQASIDAHQPGGRMAIYGHLGDGNLHLAIFPPGDTPIDPALTDPVYHTVAALGGSISAEHGIGTRRRDALAYSRNDGERAFMGDLKKFFDPRGILGAGRIL